MRAPGTAKGYGLIRKEEKENEIELRYPEIPLKVNPIPEDLFEPCMQGEALLKDDPASEDIEVDALGGIAHQDACIAMAVLVNEDTEVETYGKEKGEGELQREGVRCRMET